MRSKQPVQKHSVRAPRHSFVSSAIPLCEIVAVGKRRDGGTRFWCLRHKADATAKYGRQAKSCRAAHIKADESNAFELDIDLFTGGIALWGAVPPVFDTTRLPLDKGIHVHARRSSDDKKEIDGTFSGVRIVGGGLPSAGLQVAAIDAIYYMVSSVFGFAMRHVLCTLCGAPHLDRDWFSVHPHTRHLCANCGRTFSDSRRGVGNPICGLREAYGMRPHKKRSANRSISFRQADFPGGIQVWGSNPALIWTSTSAEEEGIHLHAFLGDEGEPEVDNTFSEVTIDGVRLDPVMVRVLMAQNTLPHLRGRVMSLTCRHCGEGIFSTGALAYTPVAEHTCDRCGRGVKATGRLRNTIGNSLLEDLAKLAKLAPRAPQAVTIDLLPETPLLHKVAPSPPTRSL